MTSTSTSAQYAYFLNGLREHVTNAYATYNDVQNMYRAQFSNAGVSPLTTDEYLQDILNIDPANPWKTPDTLTAIKSLANDAFFSMSAAYLGIYNQPVLGFMKQVKLNVTVQKSVGTVITETINQNINVNTAHIHPNEVTKLAKGMANAGVILGFAVATNQIYDVYQATNGNGAATSLEAAKQSTMLGTGIAVAATTGVGFAALFPAVAAAGLAAFVSTTAVIAVEFVWDNFNQIVYEGYLAGKTVDTIISENANLFANSLENVWNKTGDEATVILDKMGNYGEDILDDFGDLVSDYGDAQGLLPSWLRAAEIVFGNAAFIMSPLVLDLDGDGVEVSKMGYGTGASTTYFDMDNDEFAERTAWATGGDGLLVMDKNGNGKIDNQNELFGNTATYADGFLNLKQYDSNNDNQMTSADAQWNNLRVWVDADNDGQTDAGELKTLSSLNITQINLNANDNQKNGGVRYLYGACGTCG